MIQVETATVYRGAGRRFFSLRAACEAEARSIIKAKYPQEQAEYESGHITYPGFHWSGMPNAEKMLRRLTRMVRAAYNQQNGVSNARQH